MEDQEFIKMLEREGYSDIKIIEGLGYCGLRRFIFTTGLCIGLNPIGYSGRYCYELFLMLKKLLDFWINRKILPVPG